MNNATEITVSDLIQKLAPEFAKGTATISAARERGSDLTGHDVYARRTPMGVAIVVMGGVDADVAVAMKRAINFRD